MALTVQEEVRLVDLSKNVVLQSNEKVEKAALEKKKAEPAK